MLQVQQVCACGGKYWPSQRWVHEKCGVVNHQETTNAVVNASNEVVNAVVNARGKDRHKNKEARREYLRLKMREYRARKRAGSPR